MTTPDIRTILDSARRREAVVRLCLRGDLIPVCTSSSTPT